MTAAEPLVELDPRYGDEGVPATQWAQARERLEKAELFWVTTVRRDGRPHITPLIAVWLGDALYITTGPHEQKAKNIAGNPHCILMTGCNTLHEGLDLVVEGDAKRVTDDDELRRLAEAWESKYGSEWHFDVRDGAFRHEAGEAWVFEVAPVTAYGFAKGGYSHTRWRFGA
jgi:nitroimidazol reductase NimA-like FMN-containing flavoprotein (pyridoxamine 5'-phosphate oxidase superfamily)